MTDKKFDTLGWSYDQQGLLHFREAFAQAMGVRWHAESCFRALELGGGKALGLRLCERLAMVDHRIHVPTWHIPNLRPDDFARWLSVNKYVIVRSSEPDEDWLNSASGAKTSVVQSSDRLIADSSLYTRNVVVQQCMVGVGFVVDIGYSELLEQPVVRIAHGNTSREGGGARYTSATWDHECHVGVYSLQGEAMVPLRHPVFGAIAPEMVRLLVQGVQQLGITFGVQLELIIHPDMVNDRWYLVQIRPSPAAVQWDFTPLDVTGRLLETTGKISGCGNAEGDTLTLDEMYRGKEEDRITGKIVIWDCKMSRVPYDICYAAGAGAIGQVCNGTMLCNSGHGTFSPAGPHSMEMYQQATASGLLIATAYQYHPKDWRADVCRGTIKRIRIVSDGLVGQIYDVS